MMPVNTVRQVPVAILGAGPTGVAAATLLARYGIETVLLDRWAQVYPQPRAVHLDDEVYRILGALGVAGSFARISRPAQGLQLRDNRLRVLAEFARDTAVGRHGYPQANMFDQPELERLLRDNLRAHPEAELRGNVEALEIAPGGPGRVRVTYADRDDGTRHAVDARYLLGCDGANSMVRRFIGARMRDLRFEQRWLVVDLETAAELHQWEGVHQVCDPVRAATFMRIGATRYRWEFRLRPGESARQYASITALHPLIAPWTGAVGPDRLRVIRVADYTFRARIADRWRRDNVFLLGDAAHLTPPFIGQGMGAGLRDAANLAWKLAGVLAGGLPAAALDTYEVERKPHAGFMIGFALGIGWSMTAGGEVGNLLRRLIVPRLSRVPGIRTLATDSTSPPLRGSALVHKSGRRNRRGAELAGSLCPNTALADGSRLDDALGPGFALVTTVHPEPAGRAAIRRRGARVHLVETGDELAGWLRGGGATAAVIRPDRTVLCAGTDLARMGASIPWIPVAPVPGQR